MTMNGLMTALEQDIPIIVVVFNNNALGWVLHGGGPFAAEFNDFDHAAIARAMGCSGVRVDRPGRAGPGIARGDHRARADGDRRAHLAEGVVRRHHLAARGGGFAAAAIAGQGDAVEQCAAGKAVQWSNAGKAVQWSNAPRVRVLA